MFEELELSKATPEQIEAIKKTEEFAGITYILHDVAQTIPAGAPNGSNKAAWGHGSCRGTWLIGGYNWQEFENGEVPENSDLSDIRYVGFYRQSVKNKNTGEVKYFMVQVPLGFACEIHPGGIYETATKGIPIGWTREEVEVLAKESFLKLQEMVSEFYERAA